VDILFCKGGCVGGPGIISKDLQQYKEDKVIKYRDEQRKTKMGIHKGKFANSKEINLKRRKN
jgi:iron only hydrogenase large subunit-like protein